MKRVGTSRYAGGVIRHIAEIGVGGTLFLLVEYIPFVYRRGFSTRTKVTLLTTNVVG